MSHFIYLNVEFHVGYPIYLAAAFMAVFNINFIFKFLKYVASCIFIRYELINGFKETAYYCYIAFEKYFLLINDYQFFSEIQPVM